MWWPSGRRTATLTHVPHDIHDCAECHPARDLLRLGWEVGRERHEERIPYFEEAATIYRGLVGDEEHVRAAAAAISSLALQYSAVHADDLALAARHEAAGLSRRANTNREDKETAILSKLALCLAESGQFAQAVAVQREVVDIHRATGVPASDNVAWSLLDLAIYLDLAGQCDASLEIDKEALALQRRMAKDASRRVPGLAIWTVGLALWFASTDRPRQTRELLREAVAACDLLPSQGSNGNFGFLSALGAAHLARSGVRDERAATTGVDPHLARQPVHGVSFHRWSYSVQHAYREGLDAIAVAITSLDRAQLGTLMRRRTVRRFVLFSGVPEQLLTEVVPGLALSVDIERRLFADDPGRGPRCLVQALIDQALGHLVVSANADAGRVLRQAYELKW